MMSRFFSSKYAGLTPYTPGEQPKDQKYIKLNTNESPFPPSPSALKLIEEKARNLQLYSDPSLSDLKKELAKAYGISERECTFTNGSDEALYFAFLAYCDENTEVLFPEITYSFYPVFAQLNNLKYEEIPLEEDFSIDIKKYFNANKTIFIANPNAPTGIALSIDDIRKILENNKDNVVVIDEAYVDFGAQTCVPLIREYDNLLVIQTFSKSRSLAGGRLGMAIGNEKLIGDLDTIRFSTNPYNVNSLTLYAGVGSLRDDEYMKANCKTIMENREYAKGLLMKLGFKMTDSLANFLFVKHDDISGEQLYLKLKEKGVLIRHFNIEKIKDYNRITIGTKQEMDILIEKIKEIMGA